MTEGMLGRLLGKYRILSTLGSGGMATVYLGEAEPGAPGIPSGGRVAVKVVHSHLLTKESIFKRFLREARIGQQIRHENIVRTLDADVAVVDDQPQHYLVMEYVEGQTLRSLVEELGWLPEDLCLTVASRVARALAAIHTAGIVHRDIKPENVLITKDDVVKLMDLGVAFVRDETFRLSQEGQFVGSPLYAAPEQFAQHGTEPDGRTDLYQLGLLVYELSTGIHPFGKGGISSVMERQASQTLPPPGRRNPRISPFLDEVVCTLLRKNPAERFPSAAGLARILEEGDESSWWRERSGTIRRETRKPLRRVRIPRETPLWGREGESEILRKLWWKASTGEGQTLLLDGEAGIGKSRLMDEFAGRLESGGHDFNFLLGGHPPGGAATAAGAFSAAYREHLGADGLEEALAGYLTTTPALIPAFSALLKGGPPPPGGEPLTKDSIQTVFVQLTQALAAERPTLVLVEDLHYSPEEGRSLFAALAHAIAGHAVLLVGTMRPGFDAEWLTSLERIPHIRRLVLERLGFRHVQDLLTEHLGSEHLGEELCPAIFESSGGNPFFIFEILRGLRQQQRLIKKPDGTYSRVGALLQISVPSTVKDLVQARIKGLDDDDRDILDMAACIGADFDPVVLAEALGVGRIPLLKSLGRMERHFRVVHACGRTFVFDHHQVREALYEGLSALLKEAYHASLGDALERLTGAGDRSPAGLPGRICADLCDQFLRGGRGEKALRYLDSALDHLRDGHLNESVQRLAARSLEISGLLEGPVRAGVLLRQAAALELLGMRAEEREALLEALDIVKEQADPLLAGKVHKRLGNHYAFSRDRARSLEHFREAERLATEAGDGIARGAAVGGLGSVLADSGEFEAASEAYRKHLEIAREVGDRLGQAKAIGNIALMANEQGRSEEALRLLAECRPIFREAGFRRGEITVTGNRGVILLHLGRYEEAREQFERFRKVSREIGYRRGVAMALGNLGLVCQAMGRYGEAEAHLTSDLEIAREMHNPGHETVSLIHWADHQELMGDFKTSRETFEAAQNLIEETSYRGGEVFREFHLGSADLEEGLLEEAEAHLERAAEMCRSLGKQDLLASCHLALGQLHIARGETEAARRDLTTCREIADEAGAFSDSLLAGGYLHFVGAGDPKALREELESRSRRISLADRMEAHYLLFLAEGDLADLAEAHRMFKVLESNTPERAKASLRENIGLHRDLLAAAAKAGLD